MQSSQSGITRRFRSYESSPDVHQDEFGFTQLASDVLMIEDVLQPLHRAILIRARPWLGKSFVAKTIHRQQDVLDLGQQVWFTQLADISTSIEVPDHWHNWWNDHATNDHRASWIVDSIDEGESICPNISLRLLDLVRGLDDSQRSRLKLIMFCREAEVPPKFITQLGELYANNITTVELLPLDQESAKRLSLRRPFEAILGRIQQHSLSAVAGLPAALMAIDSMQDQQFAEGQTGVWRQVLMELLRNKKASRGGIPPVEVDYLFRAATHLAITTTFSGIERVDAVQGSSNNSSVEQHIGVETLPNGVTRNHAREVIRTELFSKGRFVQKNVREWLCAFGLAEFTLKKVIPLITKKDGSLNGSHMGVLRHLCMMGREDVTTWITGRNLGFIPHSDCQYSLSEIHSFLDTMEAITARTSGGTHLPSLDEFGFLQMPGLGKQLAERLSEPSRTEAQLNILFDIALKAGAREVVDIAIKTASDRKRSRHTRVIATLCVNKFGSNESVRLLLTSLQSVRKSTDADDSAKAGCIREALRRDIISIEEAIDLAPLPKDRSIDWSHALSADLEESLTSSSAFRLIRRIFGKTSRQQLTELQNGTVNYSLRNLLKKSFELVLSQEVLDSEMEKTFLQLATLSDPVTPITYMLQEFIDQLPKYQSLRRQVYLADFASHKAGVASARRHWWWLTIEDIGWLQERIESLAESDPTVWTDVLRLARGASISERRRIRSSVEAHAPDAVTEFDNNIKKYREENQRLKARARRREKKIENISIETIVNQVCTSELSLHDQMIELANLCFADESYRPKNIVGGWHELSKAQQETVLAVCREALIKCAPTAIPDGSTFPGSLIFESFCFKAILVECPNSFSINSQIISKWLPAVHFCLNQDGESIVSQCFSANQQATEKVFIRQIERDLRRGSEHVLAATNLDSQYWTPNVVRYCESQVANLEFSVISRARVFSALIANASVVPERLIRELCTSDEEHIRDVAIDGMIGIDPSEAMVFIRQEYKRRGVSFLKGLQQFRRRNGRRIDLSSTKWTPLLLGELCRILRREIPPLPEGNTGGIVTPEMELRDLWQAIPGILLRRDEVGDREQVDLLAGEFDDIGNWLKTVDAQQHLELAVEALKLNGTPPIPLPTVVRWIENPSYRIVRNHDDLLDVIEDTLAEIERTASRHLEMLYLPNDDTGHRYRRDESALQAYIDCRLTDLLPGRILDRGTQVEINREPQAPRRRRFDVKVTAPLLDLTRGTVIIEVKWSDNADKQHNTSTALSKQLGDKYLKDANFTHGIYLVGWNGKLGAWQRSGGPKPQATCDSLRGVLREQAIEYCQGCATVIRAMVFDLHYPAKSLSLKRN